MATFPDIRKPSDLVRRTIKNAYRGTSSAGYTIAFPKGTISKKEFKVTHRHMLKSDRDTLDTFFNTNQGLSFTWTDPEDAITTYEVVFNDDELEFKFSPPYYWSTTFTLREV